MSARCNSRVGAVVLAAGGSVRMGEAKQLLRLGETTVLAQTLENIGRAGVDEIVLVLGASAEMIRQQLSNSAVERTMVVVNRDYEQGMASSLRMGLSAASPRIDGVLIVLADQPFIRSETFDRIIDRYRGSDAEVVIPTYECVRGNPVLLDRAVFAEVMALEGDIGCRAIFDEHLDGIVKIEVDDAGILLDIDNRDDYERLRRFGESVLRNEASSEPSIGEGREVPGFKE